jgi:hypothetical protein
MQHHNYLRTQEKTGRSRITRAASFLLFRCRSGSDRNLDLHLLPRDLRLCVWIRSGQCMKWVK